MAKDLAAQHAAAQLSGCWAPFLLSLLPAERFVAESVHLLHNEAELWLQASWQESWNTVPGTALQLTDRARGGTGNSYISAAHSRVSS